MSVYGCLHCNDTGTILLPHENGAVPCPACRPQDMFRGNQMGKTNEARRRTMRGFMAAIEKELWAMTAGASEPKVFLYVRRGVLPDIKVTLELKTAPQAYIHIDEAHE